MIIKDDAISPYLVRVEGSQFVLVEEKKTAKGDLVENIVGYFISLPVLIRRIAQIKIAEKNAISTLDGFISEYKNIYQQVEEALKR